MNKWLPRLLIVLLIVGLFIAYKVFNLGEYFNLAYLKSQHSTLEAYYQDHGAFVLGAYFVIYVIMAAVSLPGAAILTLAGGAIFGFTTGTIVVSFASTLGATLAFLVARFLLHDFVQTKFKNRLRTINNAVIKD